MQWTKYEDELKESYCGDKKTEVMVGLVGEHIQGIDGSFFKWGEASALRMCDEVLLPDIFWVHV